MTRKRNSKNKPPLKRSTENEDFVNSARTITPQIKVEQPTPPEPKKEYKHYSVYMDEDVMDELPTLAKKWKKQTRGKKLTNTAIIRAILDATFETIEGLDDVKDEAHLVELLKQQIKA